MKVKIICTPQNIDNVQPKDVINTLFLNNNGVFNIPTSLEDVLKSQQYFGNTPQHLLFLNKGLTVASTNKSLGTPLIPNSFIVDYVNSKGKIDYIDIKIKNGEISIIKNNRDKALIIIKQVNKLLEKVDILGYNWAIENGRAVVKDEINLNT